MQNKNSKFNTVLLMIVVVLLGAILIMLVGKQIPKIDDNKQKDQQLQKNEVSKKTEVLEPKSKTINIKLTSFNYGDNNKTFNVNKGDLIVVDSDTYTDGGYTAEDIVYDKSMLRLQSQNVIGCDDPRAVGCSVSNLFKFIAIKEGVTMIKRGHYRSDTERFNLAVTLEIK